jgi:hypothetical protein
VGIASRRVARTVDGAQAPDVGVHLCERVLGLGDLEQGEQVGEDVLEALVERADAGGGLLATPFRAVLRRDVAETLEQLDHGPVGMRGVVRAGARLEDEAVRADGSGQLVDQPRLPDARLADQRDHAAASGARRRERAVHRHELVAPSGEPREAAVRRPLEARAQRTGAEELVETHRTADAPDLRRPEIAEREEAVRQRLRPIAHEDRAGGGEGLEPLRDADRVADRIVVRTADVRARGPHDDLAGVDADADGERQPALLPQPLRPPADVLLHAQRRVEGALGMVLVRDRRAEEREDAVAARVGHPAVVAVHGVRHHGEGGVDDAARVLGVEAIDQLHRPLDVGEQRGDGLALARRHRATVAEERAARIAEAGVVPVRVTAACAAHRPAARVARAGGCRHGTGPAVCRGASICACRNLPSTSAIILATSPFASSRRFRYSSWAARVADLFCSATWSATFLSSMAFW